MAVQLTLKEVNKKLDTFGNMEDQTRVIELEILQTMRQLLVAQQLNKDELIKLNNKLQIELKKNNPGGGSRKSKKSRKTKKSTKRKRTRSKSTKSKKTRSKSKKSTKRKRTRSKSRNNNNNNHK